MASKVSRRSRSTDYRAAAAEGRSGYGLLGNQSAKLLLGASVGILALTLVFTTSGMRGSARGKKGAEASSASAEQQQKDSAEKVTVKRELPEGVTEDQVPKWVPYRQPSGRTELEAWNSVDADTARDPYFRQDMLAPKESPVFLGESDAGTSAEGPVGPPEELREDESPSEEAAASAEPEQAAGLSEEQPSGALAAEEPVAPPLGDGSEASDPKEATG
jgi:hypothetical protein